MQVVRKAFLLKGITAESIPILLKSLYASTFKQYNSTYRKWWQFCAEEKISPFSSGPTEALRFLTHIFNTQSAAYGTFNSHRSALSLILANTVGADEKIRRFLKGITRLRPLQPKYKFTWDPAIVLAYLHTTEFAPGNVSLRNLTRKLCTLLLLITAERLQTLSLIRVSNIHITDRIQVVIVDETKTSFRTNEQQCLHIPFFPDKPNLCVANFLQLYLQNTAAVRNGEDQLFLTTKPPYSAASKQTISNWVQRILQDSGIDIGQYTAYSTRHAASSAAHRKGVPVDVIRKTVGWSEASGVFAKFYNRPLGQSTTFAAAVLSII